MSDKYAYSIFGEIFAGKYDSRAAALAAAREESSGEVWTGRCVEPPQPEDYFSIELLFEHVSEQDDYCGEWADCWDRSTEEQREEIEGEVARAIGRWLDKHGLRPAFYVCRDIEKHNPHPGDTHE